MRSIQIKNPRVHQIVAAELEHGAGRNPTEAAENLIQEAAEMRRLARATGGAGIDPPRRRREKVPA